jgi:NAD(P)H-hydrate epimerase
MNVVTKLYNTEQVRELDRIAIFDQGIAGLTLMKRAAEACISRLLDQWPSPGQVAVLCGSGNNAGDGFIIAGLLANRGISAVVGLVGKLPRPDSDAGFAYEFCKESGVRVVGGEQALKDSDLIVDALLGTGVIDQVRPEYAEMIEAMNTSNSSILSVDLPSGLCADTGSVLGACVQADVTVTFIGYKLGLLTNDGPEYVGELVFDDLDVPAAVYEQVPFAASKLDYSSCIKWLKPRHKNAHKVSHGHLLVVGGDCGMAGAVAMAAESALYAGAGMVSVATHPDNVSAVVARRPEVMAKGIRSAEDLNQLIERCDVIVLGPGLGQSHWSQEVFARIMHASQPMVVDADGLNLLARSMPGGDDSGRGNWVLTPHPGEAQRLINRTVQSDRLQAVQDIQRKYEGVCLLKGAGTLIASPIASSEDQISLCPYGNPGMSVAGMGDLLAGVIGGLLAQGLDLREATELGAIVHSLAADNLVMNQGERGLLATDLLPEIRALLNHKSLHNKS